jgi:hypothetical protein
MADANDSMWFALYHRAGLALPHGESVFAQPGLAEHVAFL